MARSHGEGSISQRTDGRWQASLQVGGVRQTVYARTRKGAVAKLGELQRQASVSGRLPDGGQRTVADLLTLWLDTKRPNLRATTWAHYHLLGDTYILPVIGSVAVRKLTPERVQALYSDLQAQGKRRVAVLVHCVLGQALGMAQRWGWVAENPARRVIPPSYKAGRKEVWGPSGLAMFLAGTTDHWAHPLWVTALATGARPGELCALQWKDVDLQAQVLTVSKSLQRVGGEYRLAEPKTRASVRSIALPDEAVQALLRQKGQQALWRAEAGGSWQEWGLVFTTRAGAPLHRSTVLHTLARECQRLGLPAITPHSLRHLHASLLLAQGVAIPTVSARLGHANPSITLSVYSHAITGQDAEAALAIGRALTG